MFTKRGQVKERRGKKRKFDGLTYGNGFDFFHSVWKVKNSNTSFNVFTWGIVNRFVSLVLNVTILTLDGALSLERFYILDCFKFVELKLVIANSIIEDWPY